MQQQAKSKIICHLSFYATTVNQKTIINIQVDLQCVSEKSLQCFQ